MHGKHLSIACQMYGVLFFLCGLFLHIPAFGQPKPEAGVDVQAKSSQSTDVINQVDIKPKARDEEIRDRLEGIMNATQWYKNPNVKVQEGVVFLQGTTETEKHKEWAEALAHNTQDVVAVVNRIKIVGPKDWYLKEIMANLQEQWHRVLLGMPFVVFALLVLAIAWFIARLAATSARQSLRYRGIHPLLTEVIARGVIILCFILGIYVILKVLGLTTIALTLLGGTGVLGIILGIAFRDITENLLASVLLSIQKPFNKNDLIEVADVTGYVEALTIRATVLMTQDGHQVQIPNAAVYKSNIFNFTKNANQREDFIIGIGYLDAISYAQEVVLNILEAHPAVLSHPEPWVLVEELTADSVNLHVYLWLDSSKHNWCKVKSSVIRLVKRAFQDKGISMPGRGVDLRFNEELSINLLQPKDKERHKKKARNKESRAVVTQAEKELSTEASEIEEQVRRSRTIDEEQNLLTPNQTSSKE